MISGRVRAAGAVLGFVLGVFPALALAQTEPMLPVPAVPVTGNVPAEAEFPLQQGLTVVGRPRPELDPLGFPVGEFFFYPRFELDESYNDNIFGARTSPKGDFITTEMPAFDLKSNFGTNALNLSAGAALSEYISNPNFDTQDYYLKGDGRLDVDNVRDFHGNLSFAHVHYDPGAPIVAGNAIEPLKSTTYGGGFGFEQTKLRVTYSVDFAALRSEYEAQRGLGGITIPNSDSDNWAYELALRGGYEFQPGYQAYLRGSTNFRDYDHSAGIGFPIRNSYGYRGDAGLKIDLTGVLYVEAYFGYFDQIYQSALLGSISGPDFGANLVWNPTQLTSVSFNVSRAVEDAPVAVVGAASSPGFIHTVAGVRVDHELLRNLLLDGEVTFANDDFQGENRTDNDYLASIGAKYLLNRNLYLGASYTFEHRDSSGTQAINQFNRNIVMLRASTQF